MEKNKIYNMDCLQGLRNLESESIDLTVTSPPYDNLRDYNGFTFDFENIAKELYRVTKQGGVVVWIVNDATVNGSETGTSFRQALFFKDIGFNLHDTMIYEKNSMSMPDNIRYYQKFEYMFVLSKVKPKTFNPIKDHKNTAKRWSKTFNVYNADGTMTEKNRDLEVNEFGVRFNIWKYNTGFSQSTNDKINHPAIFPEKLANDHIVSWSNKNDLVLDPFIGSGTTAKMALLNNRDFIGFDISKEYCELANKRIQPLLNQVNIFEIIGE